MATITVNGVELYHERQGSGEPVVLVHGGMGDADSWQFLIPELVGHFEVITYDQRGHTRSERPDGALTTDDLVADLGALIDGLGIAPAHVAGISLGGTVILGLAARSPDLLRSLSVHEPGAFGLIADDPAAESERRFVAETLGEMQRGFQQDPIEALRGFAERILPGGWELVPDELRERMADNGAYEFRGGGRLSFDIDLDGLARCSAPALLTQGDQTPKGFGWDRIMPILDDALPDSRLVTIKGTGHVPAFTHPAEYGAVLREHFAAVRTA